MADNKFPNCTQTLCDQYRPQIQQRCKDSSFPPGSPIVVYNPKDGGWCYCYCGGQSQIPDCTQAVCDQYRAEIQERCKDNAWPVGSPVLIRAGDSWCNCHCGGQSQMPSESAANVIAPETPMIDPCGVAICNYDPQILLACANAAPGTPIIRTGRDHQQCKCYCWDGELAPYQVLDGNGNYVALDTLPVGGFVMASGLSLDWYKVLVRTASRPAQSIPQPAVEIVIDQNTVIVPTSHLFLTYEKKLITAAQLDPRMVLMGTNKNPVAVDQVIPGEQAYVFQFISTAQDVLPIDLSYHLLDMYGIVTCDDAVRQAYLARSLPASLLAFPYPK